MQSLSERDNHVTGTVWGNGFDQRGFEVIVEGYEQGNLTGDQLEKFAVGAYVPLNVVECQGKAYRVQVKVENEESGDYTRYIEIPFEAYGEEILQALDSAGWPRHGVQCRHHYSPCGYTYCSAIAGATTREGKIQLSQRVWRNV